MGAILDRIEATEDIYGKLFVDQLYRLLSQDGYWCHRWPSLTSQDDRNSSRSFKSIFRLDLSRWTSPCLSLSMVCSVALVWITFTDGQCFELMSHSIFNPWIATCRRLYNFVRSATTFCTPKLIRSDALWSMRVGYVRTTRSMRTHVYTGTIFWR